VDAKQTLSRAGRIVRAGRQRLVALRTHNMLAARGATETRWPYTGSRRKTAPRQRLFNAILFAPNPPQTVQAALAADYRPARPALLVRRNVTICVVPLTTRSPLGVLLCPLLGARLSITKLQQRVIVVGA